MFSIAQQISIQQLLDQAKLRSVPDSYINHFLDPSMMSFMVQIKKFIAFISPLIRNPSIQVHFYWIFIIKLKEELPN